MKHLMDKKQRSGSNPHLIQQGKTDGLSCESFLNGCRLGDAKAQKAVYDLLSPKMFSLCLRYMGNREDAEDTLQEGFVTLFSKIGSYSGEGSFEGWARKIFVNTALMSLRKKDLLKNSEELDGIREVAGSGVTQLQKIGYAELMGMIRSLPPGYRTVFNMYVVEGYSHREISKALGISEVTSRSQLSRARAMMKDKIENEKH